MFVITENIMKRPVHCIWCAHWWGSWKFSMEGEG